LRAGAQAPKGADRLSPAAVAESLSVLDDLDQAVRKNSSDAALWYRRGMLAWALAERDRHEPRIPTLDRTRLGRMADTSLRIAAEIDKDNAYYRLMSARYLLSSEASISRAASYGMFEKALETARVHSDPYTHSEAAVETGRVYWRRYDGLADRFTQFQSDVACEPITGQLGRTEVERMRDQIKQCAMPVGDEKDISGEGDYLRAEQLFREAYDAQPSNQRAYRQLSMLLAERKRWTELGALAKFRLEGAPWDAWAWLTLGLTLHERHSDPRTIVAAFDSAFTLLPPEEVRWFSGFQRVLRPADTIKYASADPSTRFAMHRLFWTSANPLWSRDAAQPQLDFLSRVVYAELRWTVEEMNVRGADSDRGDVYVRYGAPDLVMARRTGSDPGNPIATTWIYNRGLVFSFFGQPSFATARIPPNDQAIYGDIVKAAPALWTEAPGFKLDSIPVQLARFRGRADSVDVVVATLPPIDAIQASSEIRGAVRTDFWMLAGGTVTVVHDSVVPAVPGIRTFTKRVRPRDYVFRVEASSDGSLHGARATAAFRANDDERTGFTLSGFGMSDVLLATRADEGRSTPVRWSDLTVTPLVGAAIHGTPLWLVWENYDLQNDNGAVKYAVTIALQRTQSATGRLSAQIVSRLAGSVGVERADDRVTLSYERNMPYTTTRVDNVSLSLGDTPPGQYTLTITITDKTSGKSTSRTAQLEVRAK
jgi:GWxTD domain-containing protein